MQDNTKTSLSPLSFRPVGSTESLCDLFDLDELFQDDFYPVDVDFGKYTHDNIVDDNESIVTINYDATGKTKNNINADTFDKSIHREQMYSIDSSRLSSFTQTLVTSKASNKDPSINFGESIKINTGHEIKNKRTIEPENNRLERRERNREHAKKSRVRKKLLLDSLQEQLVALRKQNINLRRIVTDHCSHMATNILSECTTPESNLLAVNNGMIYDGKESNEGGSEDLTNSKMRRQSAKILMEPDYRLIHSLVKSQQNFVLSDPSLPDNPIVYVSDGFCKLTGYKRYDVLGRNCRFLQGPGTDQVAVDVIRHGISTGKDISVCLLNYKADGSPFWNHFFLAALKDADGQIVNYVGVQCEVNTVPVMELKDRVKKLPVSII